MIRYSSLVIGHWSLVLVWSLVIGHWSFGAEVASPLSPADAQKAFQLADASLRTELAAAEPEVIDPVAIRFDDRAVKYDFGELDEVSLAYAVTIHKSQGSEFPAVVIPLATQHYMLLQRNLIYTGITRGKKLVVVIGQKKALGIAVHNDRPQRRYSGLLASLQFKASSKKTVPPTTDEGD